MAKVSAEAKGEAKGNKNAQCRRQSEEQGKGKGKGTGKVNSPHTIYSIMLFTYCSMVTTKYHSLYPDTLEQDLEALLAAEEEDIARFTDWSYEARLARYQAIYGTGSSVHVE